MREPDDRFLTCREVLRWHYDHRNPLFLGPPRRHYSLHYTYLHAGRWYVASKVRKEPGRVPFNQQFAIIRALERSPAGGIVRSPIATRWPGRHWVTGTRNRWFVRPYTDHDCAPDWRSPHLVADAARKLALIHRTSNAIGPGILLPSARRLRIYDWAMFDVLQYPDAIVMDMRARSRPPGQIMAVHAGLTRLRAAGRRLDLGPRGLTHHDLRTANLLVRENEVVEIVDWDRAHWDVQWYDVTLAALHIAHCRTAVLRWDLAETFVGAYQAESGYEIPPDALGWLFRFTAVRNLAVSRSPEKWARLVRGVEERWGGVGSVVVGDLVAEDEVAADLDVAAEDGGPLGAVGVG
ncbi:phosphotransferase [Actinomadura chokoriensis]|uniref:phosphotransferase n=1 Tax=Actinomadura chokoriensis TaxID=454156 RepID=UPI0031F90DDC